MNDVFEEKGELSKTVDWCDVESDYLCPHCHTLLYVDKDTQKEYCLTPSCIKYHQFGLGAYHIGYYQFWESLLNKKRRLIEEVLKFDNVAFKKYLFSKRSSLIEKWTQGGFNPDLFFTVGELLIVANKYKLSGQINDEASFENIISEYTKVLADQRPYDDFQRQFFIVKPPQESLRLKYYDVFVNIWHEYGNHIYNKKDDVIPHSKFNKIDSKHPSNWKIIVVRANNPDSYLFSWDDVPNKIDERFTRYIRKLMKQKNLGEGRITVEKPDNKRIKVSTSTDGKFLLLKLNDKKTEVDVEIDDKIIDKFIAEAEESKLNVYLYSNINEITIPPRQIYSIYYTLNRYLRTSQQYKYPASSIDITFFIALLRFLAFLAFNDKLEPSTTTKSCILPFLGAFNEERTVVIKKVRLREWIEKHFKENGVGRTFEEFANAYMNGASSVETDDLVEGLVPIIVELNENEYLLNRQTLEFFMAYLIKLQSLSSQDDGRLKRIIDSRKEEAGTAFEEEIREILISKNWAVEPSVIKVPKKGKEWDIVALNRTRDKLLLIEAKYRDLPPSSFSGDTLLAQEVLPSNEGKSTLIDWGNSRNDAFILCNSNHSMLNEKLTIGQVSSTTQLIPIIVTKWPPLIKKYKNISFMSFENFPTFVDSL